MKPLHSLALALALLLSAAPEAASPKEQPLLDILRSQAPPAEKALACKQLAIYGSKEAVPLLAPMLADPALHSWARIALEAIPDPAATEALRAALGQLHGRLLVGVINSLAFRRDAQAVDPLIKILNGTEAEAAPAAATALGDIGGNDAAKALEKALSKTTGPLRSSVAEGCIRCAEHLLAANEPNKAAKLYDLVRSTPNLPTQRQLEATRGAILARKDDGIPLLLEQLRSTNKSLASIGLSTARELPGEKTSLALAAELPKLSPDRQAALTLALADRPDPAAAAAVLHIAAQSAKPARLAALRLLDRYSTLPVLPILLDAAADTDTDIAKTARTVAQRVEGPQVDATIVNRLANASGSALQSLIEIAAARNITEALPAIIRAAQNSDPAVRRAAFGALGDLGTEAQVSNLVALLTKTTTPRDRSDIQKALASIGSRTQSAAVRQVLPLASNPDPNLRTIAIRVLASMGGPESLQCITKAVADTDSAVQDEAVDALATWPNNWPDDAAVAAPLLALAKDGTNPARKVQGLRGYFAYLQEDKHLSPADKLARVKDALALCERPEEKRLAVSVLGATPSAPTLELLSQLAADAAVTDEACLAILKVAASDKLKSDPARAKALQVVVDKTTQDSARKKASEMLK